MLYLNVQEHQKSLLECEVLKKEMVQELHAAFQKFHLCNKLAQQQLVDLQFVENCQKNLFSQEQPYGPAKFRTKVNENTPPYELPIHRQATTDNINREITVLQERRINWTKEIENMDTKLKDLIDSLDLSQEIRNEIKLQNQNKIKNDEERNVTKWNKHLDYLINIHNKEQNDDSVDNLLKIVG